MAIGDKKSVVMESDRAVPGGVATLGTDGKLAEEQRPGYTINQVGGLQAVLDAKQNIITAKGLLKGGGSGNVSAAMPGEDFGWPALTGSKEPTDSTKGAVGQHYLDTDTGKEYICVEADAESRIYTWKESGGGISFTVDDTLTLSDEEVLRVTTPVQSVISQEDYDQLPEKDKNIGLYVIPGDGSTNNLDIYDIINASGSARMHASIYRGKYLGDHVTDKQFASISGGTFDGLYIGDYWTIGGVNWRIADFDYWLWKGDQECKTHHAVIVPDTNLVNAQMNSTNITTGGYFGSDIYTGTNGNVGLSSARATINNAFGSNHIMSKRSLFTNAVTNGKPTGGTWYDSTVDLMNEVNVYGSYIFTPANDGTTSPYLYTTDYTQLALFRLDPTRVCNRAYWWLRDVVSAENFAIVGTFGFAYYGSASYSIGVRPAFAIC